MVIRVCDWLDNFPLQTVQRVFHIMFPATKDWKFTTLDDRGCDDDIFKKFYWTDVNEGHPDTSVVVACQPPWIMSDEVMWQFAQLKSVCALTLGFEYGIYLVASWRYYASVTWKGATLEQGRRA